MGRSRDENNTQEVTGKRVPMDSGVVYTYIPDTDRIKSIIEVGLND